jgi:hypothetical protein
MSKSGALRYWLAIGGLLVALLRQGTATAGTTSGTTSENLVVNGNAEGQRCTDDWTAQTSIPGWRVTRGAAAVLCYAAFRFTGETPVVPKGAPAGDALFAAPGADTAMEQIVDVGAAAAAIDEGHVGFTLSAWLGGWRDRPGCAITAIFLNRRGRATGSPVVIANADAEARARGGLTGLLARSAHGLVPRGTRRISVTVQFLSGATSFNDAYADNISLTLSGDGGGDVSGLKHAAMAPPAARIPALDHVVVVMMENTNFSDVIHVQGTHVSVDDGMPFTAALAHRGVVLDNMWGTYHPSDQNYVAMIAGDTFKFGLTYFPDYDLRVPHLGDLLNDSGKSWKAYVQDMMVPCNLESQGSGQESYSPDDQPFVQFQDVIGDAARCAAGVRDLSDFTADIARGTLPDFAWIAADNWWDGEGAWYENYDVAYSNTQQDQFLRSALQPLLQSAAWQNSRSLAIVTWDESGGWGWPDNRVPTILVGSPGLLAVGGVFTDHVNGYDLLRTIESALRVRSLGRYDEFAQPLNAIFAAAEPGGDDGSDADADADANTNADAALALWPAAAIATRGSLADTFGQVTTPAAVYRGQALNVVAASKVGADAVLNIEPVGHVPTLHSESYRFADDRRSASIPTGGLAPGVYGVWLRDGTQPPQRAPLMATVLPPASINPDDQPGVEIVGASAGDATVLEVREGSNLGVHYCFPADSTPALGWVGVFAAGTPVSELTKDTADAIGFWLKTPGGQEAPTCGAAQAFASELAPNQEYQVLLLYDTASGATRVIGHGDAFRVTPALPP